MNEPDWRFTVIRVAIHEKEIPQIPDVGLIIFMWDKDQCVFFVPFIAYRIRKISIFFFHHADDHIKNDIRHLAPFFLSLKQGNLLTCQGQGGLLNRGNPSKKGFPVFS
jgi:hypothetical protein